VGEDAGSGQRQSGDPGGSIAVDLPIACVALAGLVIAVIGVFPNLRTFRWYEDRVGR